MTKLYDLKEIIATTGLPERTVRYYLSKVLEAPSGTPGRKSYYEKVTVDQLMLAQQILMRDYDPDKGEVKPTLREFREWLDGLTDQEIERLVSMPYRESREALRKSKAELYRPISSSEMAPAMMIRKASNDQAESEKDAMRRADKRVMENMAREDRKENHRNESRSSASQYLDNIMASPRGGSRGQRPRWQTHQFGDDLQIRTRKTLSREQKEQLQMAGRLLKSIVEGK